MTDDTKHEITVVLDLLKSILIKNGVSIATDKNGNLMFFDTDTYVKNGGNKFDGCGINIKDLVR